MEKSRIITDPEDNSSSCADDSEPPTKRPTPASPVHSSSKPPLNSQRTSNRLNDTINSGTTINTTPIAALSPYQNRCVIKALIGSKSEIRPWSNARGEGKLFNMILIDETSEIKCTGFREACDKFYDMLEVGKTYYISRCQVKPANRQFNSGPNDFEMVLGNTTEIALCEDDDMQVSAPMVKYNFTPIENVAKMESKDSCDVLAIINSVSEVQTLTARSTGRELKKRDIELVDMSSSSITLTLWGNQAEDFKGDVNSVLAIKGAKVGEYSGGKNLASVMTSIIQIDPDLTDAHRLRGWWTTSGKDHKVSSLSVAGGGMTGLNVTLEEAKQEATGSTDATNFLCVGVISHLKSNNAVYKACPAEGCNKKVIDHEESFKCEKCGKSYPNFKYRLLAQLSISDYTSQIWATAFSGEAEKILEATAQEIGELDETNEEEHLAMFAKASFKEYQFRLRMQMETYNDNVRLRTTVQRFTEVNYQTYNRELLNIIKKNENSLQ